MLKKIMLGFLAISASSCEIAAIIVEHSQMIDILNYVKKSDDNAATIVIFDLDNTLVKPEKNLGGAHWFNYFWDTKINEGLAVRDAFTETLRLWTKIQPFVKLIPVEQNTVAILREVQKRACYVIGLTHRSVDLAQVTINQLNTCEINFSASGLEKNFTIDTSKMVYRYQKGIIFCSAYYDKGKALIELFEQINYKPKKVIFIDDVLDNVKAVEKVVNSATLTIEYTGIHYTHLEKTLFDPQHAERELAEIKLPIA